MYKRRLTSYFPFLVLFVSFLLSVRMLSAQTDTTNENEQENRQTGLVFTVTADAADVENRSQDITIITETDIESLHAKTVSEVLQKNGCYIKRYGAYGSASSVYVRGFSGSCVAILIDGIQVNSNQTGVFDLSRININDVEKIEIVRGASDNKYTVSGAVGGIVNIITKKGHPGQRPSLYTSFENTTYSTSSIQNLLDTQTYSLGTAFGIGKSGWNISGTYTGAKNSFPYTYDETFTRVRKNDDAHTGAVTARGIFALSEGSQLSVDNNWYYGDVLCPGPLTSTTTGEQKDTFVSTSALLDIPFAGSDALETQAQVSYKYDRTGYTNDINYANAGSSLHQLHTIAATNRWTYHASDSLSLSAAGDISYDYLDSTDSGIHGRTTGGTSISADILLWKKLKLYPSCKLLYSSDEIIPIPKAGISWSFLPELSLSANAYRMFTLPTFNELYWDDVGNTNLANEDGYGGDVILLYTGKSGAEIKFSAFTTYYQNKIQWITSSSGLYAPRNTGKAAYFGGSVSAKTDPSKIFSAGATYNLTLTYLLTGDLTLADNKRIMYTPVHTGAAYVAFAWKKFRARCTGTYTGFRYISDLNKTYLDSYFLLDLSTDYHLTKPVTVYAAVKNLLDTVYYETENYPMPGISFTVGVKAEW